MFCLGCNYDLRGTRDRRCPECGRPFDPDRLESFARRPCGPLGRWLARPPGWITLLLVLTVAGICLWETRILGYHPWTRSSRPQEQFTVGVILAVTLGRLLVQAGLVASGCRSPDDLRRSVIRLAGFFVVLIVTAMAIRLEIPPRVAFRLSRPSLDRFAEHAALSPNRNTHYPRWVGLYEVRRGTVTADRVQLEIDSLNSLVYRRGDSFTDDPARDGIGYRYEAMGGNWYLARMYVTWGGDD